MAKRLLKRYAGLSSGQAREVYEKSRGTFIQQSRAVPPAQKALYHAELGAGKSRVVRNFFDLSPADAEAIAERLQASLDRRLAAGS